MKALKIITLISILFTSVSALSIPQKARTFGGNDWEKLGSKIVNMKTDHDVLMVTRHEGFYKRVKFMIHKAPIHLKNVHIIFGNGENKNIVFNKRFTAGTSTRIIDLPGNKRIIKKINLNYKSIPTGNGRAIVSAWGKH